MKRLFLLGLLLVASFSAQALDACFTGSWYDASTNDGRGIDVQVLSDDFMAGYFYTWYGAERELFTMVGSPDNMDGYQSLVDGAHWVGKASFTVIDNDHIVFSYNWKHDFRRVDNTMRWCNYDCSGTIEYVRLTQPVPCE